MEVEEVEGELRIKGKGVSKGKIEGTVLKSNSPLSLAEDINLDTSEILDLSSGINTKQIKGRILVFPHEKPQEQHSNILGALKQNDMHPLGLIAQSLSKLTLQDAIGSKIPVVEKMDISLLENGDDVVMNGKSGTVELRYVTLKNITTSIITSQGQILILRRSDSVGTYQGRWACVSGYIEQGETADETALREISEELSLDREDIQFERKGKIIYARDKTIIWGIHPFLFTAKKPEIKLDWEHENYRWIFPDEIDNYETVPKLKETIKSVLTDG